MWWLLHFANSNVVRGVQDIDIEDYGAGFNRY